MSSDRRFCSERFRTLALGALVGFFEQLCAPTTPSEPQSFLCEIFCIQLSPNELFWALLSTESLWTLFSRGHSCEPKSTLLGFNELYWLQLSLCERCEPREHLGTIMCPSLNQWALLRPYEPFLVAVNPFWVLIILVSHFHYFWTLEAFWAIRWPWKGLWF